MPIKSRQMLGMRGATAPLFSRETVGAILSGAPSLSHLPHNCLHLNPVPASGCCHLCAGRRAICRLFRPCLAQAVMFTPDVLPCISCRTDSVFFNPA